MRLLILNIIPFSALRYVSCSFPLFEGMPRLNVSKNGIHKLFSCAYSLVISFSTCCRVRGTLLCVVLPSASILSRSRAVACESAVLYLPLCALLVKLVDVFPFYREIDFYIHLLIDLFFANLLYYFQYSKHMYLVLNTM